ncbi:MAG: DNA-processing protein DprA [Alphaproteobacteria bacterium]|nr:DNA-processing protein DprA [Alphaproteobacteria bacterium]
MTQNQDKNLIDIIRLIRTEHVTELTFARMMEDFGTASAAIEGITSIMKNAKKNLKIPSIADAMKEIELAQKNNIEIINFTEDSYPPLLKQIENFPPVLFVKGNAKLLKKSAVAIVGTRTASIQGQQNASNFASQLGEQGFLVISGMAKGIDASAHYGSLSRGTVAVLGCGVDIVYPRENKQLYEKIIENGAIISEFPTGTAPLPYHFPKRNRIISGISRGVLVIEASLNSGSMITARLALDQGREVFALPGSPGDPRSQGTNSLIKDGAVLTDNIDDIINIIKQHKILSDIAKDKYSYNTPKLHDIKMEDMDKVKKYLMEILSSAPISIDSILQHNKNNFSYNQISAAILELELIGKIERHPNNKISLIHLTA